MVGDKCSSTVSGLFPVQVNGALTINGTLINSGSHTSADFIVATGGITVYGTYNHARDGGNSSMTGPMAHCVLSPDGQQQGMFPLL